ncbi:MAG: hypothetical protein AMXMBFR58_30800 [Phycisphaerae bacterium]
MLGRMEVPADPGSVADSGTHARHQAPDRRVPTVGSTIGAFFVMLAVSTVGLFAVGIIVALVLIMAGTAPNDVGKRFETEPELGIIVGSGFQAGALIVAFAWRPRRAIGARKRLGLVSPGLSAGSWATLLLASGVPMWLSLLAASTVPSLGGGEQLEDMWGTFSVAGSIAWVLYIGLVPGFCEELFFRGFFQRRLQYHWSTPASIALASILFALLHVDPPAMALALILGVWLGWVAWRTGSILPTIATHVLVNASWNTGQIIVRQANIPEVYVWWAVGMLTAISLVCFILTVVRLGRAPAPALPAYQASPEDRSS